MWWTDHCFCLELVSPLCQVCDSDGSGRGGGVGGGDGDGSKGRWI